MRARAATLGVIALVLAGATALAFWFVRPRGAVRYVGEARGARAEIELRLDGADAPAHVTLDLGNGLTIVAHRINGLTNRSR